MIVLGFDFGLRRIGIATGQTITGSASPLQTLHHQGQPDWAAIESVIQEWKPQALIVGRPVHLDEAEHEMTAAAERFARRLEGRFGLPVHHVDERLTSIEAEKIYNDERRAGGRRRGKEAIDAIAAQLILENWLNAHAS